MKNNLQVIYRISDKGNPKPKLPNGGKWDCLFNAVQEFGAENFHVIADNCTEETVKALRATGLSLELTANGNAGTCRYIFEEVINRYAPDDNLYLLEDDYLHLPGSRMALLEGLEIADYVTLYDHPDLYHPDGKGDNPFVHDDLPKSSIFLTAHSHWRSTVSTTMTFAAKAKTLIEDRDVWNRFCVGKIPADFPAFIILTGQDDLNEAKRFSEKGWENLAELVVKNYLSGRKKRLLISPIPAFSTHTETAYLSPLVDWSRV
ncbi:MAG: hypothetical protein II857_01695 [Selenomonadaceae bacterium]|nr:hypothetical protein [Selenomonadaceae bacterium]